MKTILSRRWLEVALGALLMLQLTGCMSSKTKLKASNSIGELQNQLEKQDEAQQKTVESLVRQTLELQRASLRSLWNLRKQEVKTKLYALSEARLTELKNTLAEEINRSLAPVEKRLDDEINAEGSRGAAGVEKANSLRLQLASTLALIQQEAAKTELEIEQRMVKERTQLLLSVDHEFKSPPGNIEAAVTDAEMETLLADYRKQVKEYRAMLKQTTDGLKDFVTVAEPWQLFLKGLLGDSLYSAISPKLNEKLNSTQSTVEMWLEKQANSLLQKAQEKINSVQKKA
jgi:hypothetical protein